MDLVDALRSQLTLKVQNAEFVLKPNRGGMVYLHDIKLNTGADWSFETEKWYNVEEIGETAMEQEIPQVCSV